MTNLERAAAIAAERGWPLVETYRGWAIYKASGPIPYGSFSPHELDWDQFWVVFTAAFDKSEEPTVAERLGWPPVIGEKTLKLARTAIDRWEAAREAMPATAFFGVEQEVVL